MFLCSCVEETACQYINMSRLEQHSMVKEKKAIVTGQGDVRISVEYGHGLSFRYPVQMLLPCSLNGRVFPDHKAICHYCSKRTWCPDKDMLLESEGDWTIRINPVRAVFELSPMRKRGIRPCLRIPLIHRFFSPFYYLKIGLESSIL